jgi:dGTPase
VLETRYADFPGLNLTREVLEGQARRANKSRGGENGPGTSPLLEVQVVDAADSIAYDAHDADDSLEIGLLNLGELLAVPLWREARERIVRRKANLDDTQMRRAIVHELIDWQVRDIVGVVEEAIAERRLDSVAAVRSAGMVVRPSAELAEKKLGLERFLFDRVYRHPRVLAGRGDAQHALRQMFALLVSDASRLPAKFRRLAECDGLPRAVGDYLAGMTDRFALEEHGRLVTG